MSELLSQPQTSTPDFTEEINKPYNFLKHGKERTSQSEFLIGLQSASKTSALPVLQRESTRR